MTVFEYSQFISTAPHKTPKARVVVTSLTFGNNGYIYEVPSGFQYDRYLSWKYPDFIIECQGSHNGWEAKVVHKETGLLEIHTGVFIRNDGEKNDKF